MKTRNFFYTICLVFMVFNKPGFAQDADKPLQSFQFSILPLLGTDGAETRNNIYSGSVNLFAGITGGIQGFELGGLLNITDGNVEGLQFSGFGNAVTGNFQGVQISGFLNAINGNSKGLNFSGFINAVRESHQGVQGSGFMNVTGGDFKGVSGSGFMNATAGSFEGIHGTGFINVSRNGAKGILGAGFGNVNGGNSQGVHISGFFNYSDNFEGAQLSGFINVARHMKGVQVGFINLSDTIDGIPVGFLSIVRRGGLRQIEVAANDIGLVNASFKIGVPAFYNIFSLGYYHRQDFKAPGFGVGTRFNVGHSSYIHLEGHSSSLMRDWRYNEKYVNLLNELRAIYGLEIAPGLQFFAGLTIYNQVFRTTIFDSPEDLSIAPRTFSVRKHNDWTSQYWLGGRAGMTFALR
jgi:hypothetical protein